jgi:hypothetical protein
MRDDIDRRTVLAATGAGIAMGLTGIASGERTDDGDATTVVTAGVTHRIDGGKRGLEVWTVDDIPPYRVRDDEGAVAVHGHPERDVVEAFRRSAAVADLRGHPAAAAVGAGEGRPDGGLEAAGYGSWFRGRGLDRSIVTELGPQHRVMERVATEETYEPPRVAVRAERDAVALEAAGDGGGPAALAAGESVRRALPERELALRTRDGGSRDATVTPVLEARHHGRLRVVEERPGGGPVPAGGEIGGRW